MTILVTAPAAPAELTIPALNLRTFSDSPKDPGLPEVLEGDVKISLKDFKSLNLVFTAQENLAALRGWGCSMAPSVFEKDIVVVDRGVQELQGDDVYLFSWGGALYMKRLCCLGGSMVQVVSDNPSFPAQAVMLNELTIHAKVLPIWKSVAATGGNP